MKLQKNIASLMTLLAAIVCALVGAPAFAQSDSSQAQPAESSQPPPDSGDSSKKKSTTVKGERSETKARKDEWWGNDQGQGGGSAQPQEQNTATEPAPASAVPAESAPPEQQPEQIPVKEAQAAKPIKGERTELEDIQVTAQKRVQSIQDVPISISAMNAEFIHEQGLTDIRDAMALMPNVKMEEAGFFTAPRIRGFTFNNNNKAFEPPVGIAIDGIPYTRPEYFMMTLFDIDRVEVLRGPQGTTFGKNTTAGVVSLMTKDPTSSPEGRLQLQGGELQRKHIEGAYGNGMIGDFVDFRISGLYDERDGYIKNTYHDIDPTVPGAYRNRKRTGGRLKLGFPDLFGSALKLSAEHVDLLSGGAAFEYVKTTPDFDSAVYRYDPGFDTVRGNWVDSEDFPGFRDVHITTFNGQWDYGLGGWNIVGVGGHSVMWQNLQLDVDFTSAPSTVGYGSDRSPTTTFELRSTSPTFDGLLGWNNIFGWHPGKTDVLIGGFYEKRDILNSIFRFGVNDQATGELVQGANGNTGTGAVGGEFGGVTANDLQQQYEEVIQLFNQHAQAIGAFTHMKWQFLPKWATEIGVRYTTEQKDADWDLHFTTPPPNALMGRLGFVPFTDALTRKESNIQPKIAIDYTLTDTTNLFAHWTRGFKGGGYNAFAYRNTDDTGTVHTTKDLQYEPEITTETGFDVKSRLFGNTLHANLSLYQMRATNFQVLVRNNPSGTIGLGTTQVANAEGARARGAELDLTWLVSDWFTVIGASGYNDTRYLKFTHNDCSSDVPAADKPCDASGKPFPYSPLWNNALSLVSNIGFERLPLLGRWIGGMGLDLFASVTGEHQTSSYLDTDLDPRAEKKQQEFYRLKANIGVGNPQKRWTFRVIGENLNNVKTWIRCGDIFAGEVACSQNEPRLIFAQLQQEF